MVSEAIDLSPEKLRALVAAADHGSFSAAAAALGKSQSAVSQNIASLEATLAIPLFDRSGYRPALTAAGQRVLEHARRALEELDGIGGLARTLGKGVEAVLSIAVDEMFPMECLLIVLHDLRGRFPTTRLDVRTGPLGEVAEMVVRRTVGLGLSGPLEIEPDGLTREPIATIGLVPVAAPHHPLAKARGPLSDAVLRPHVQVTLTDRSPYTAGFQRGTVGSEQWLVGSLATKRSVLLAGLGWGTMPRHLVADDIDRGALVKIRPEGWPNEDFQVDIDAVFLKRDPPGRAGRWLIERLAHLAGGRRERPRPPGR